MKSLLCLLLLLAIGCGDSGGGSSPGLAPDLTAEITSLPAVITIDTAFGLGFSVENIGPGDSPATELGVWITDTSESQVWTPWAPISIPALASGESYSDIVGLGLTASLSSGTDYWLVIEADWMYNVPESDEWNNEYAQLFEANY